MKITIENSSATAKDIETLQDFLSTFFQVDLQVEISIEKIIFKAN